MSRILQLWRTTTVRLTAMFVLMFVLFSVLLLGVITWQSSIQIQRQQANEIERDAAQLQQLDRVRGIRSVVFAVDRLSRQPGPGIYYLGDPTGLMITGNVGELPVNVLQDPGIYSFDYERPGVVDGEVGDRAGTAVVRSLVLDSGLILVVGRDVAERRGFTAIIFQSFLFGVGGILLFSIAAGVITSLRVLRRIDAITSTSTKIMSGNLSERIAVTGRNDEFDALATSLNKMLDRIEQLMQGLKEVSDNIAHDLKTPLNRLRNKAEAALRDGSGGASQREALESIIAESDKLIRTFNALLMIARAEAGTPSGAGAEIDVSAVAADVAELYAPVAEEAGIELVTDIEPAVRLRANRELIGQALVNLVENALKYVGDVDDSESRSLRIAVAVRRQQGRVLVAVSDNGPGIPEEQRQRVLERFVRLEQSRTEPGSGLGLSLVAAVARLYAGDFRIEDNAPGVRAVIDLPEA
ncbi:MAG TPA: HAMP domain-containing sensor histidine kinase [Devosiaceae bacterium]|nr:HAMP domain-containing sensor histidine kinase [Devosiaceae bacterium]